MDIRHCRATSGVAEHVEDVFAGELSDRKACDEIAASLQRQNIVINGLICNAGSGKSVQMGDEDPKDWEKSFNDNFYSAVNLIQALENSVLAPEAKIIVIGLFVALGIFLERR